MCGRVSASSIDDTVRGAEEGKCTRGTLGLEQAMQCTTRHMCGALGGLLERGQPERVSGTVMVGQEGDAELAHAAALTEGRGRPVEPCLCNMCLGGEPRQQRPVLEGRQGLGWPAAVRGQWNGHSGCRRMRGCRGMRGLTNVHNIV
uniref:Uncharacterized protein n=1 Tax=Eutreptiella gymnastica TaxID=73025 RepID=A0A7S4CWJ7_9EUGL